MSFLAKLLGTEPDPRERLRPLWHRVVEISRDPSWYAECGVEDSVTGRFDMITAVLSAVMVRLEASDLRSESAFIAELFVEDMEGQIREFGINDVVVGKRMGKLFGVLGGRLGAYRPALVEKDRAKLSEAIERNTSFGDAGSAECVADKLMTLSAQLAELDDSSLIEGNAAT